MEFQAFASDVCSSSKQHSPSQSSRDGRQVSKESAAGYGGVADLRSPKRINTKILMIIMIISINTYDKIH